jgi:hypothetical protein
MRVTDKILSQYPERLRYFYRFVAAYHCGSILQDEYTAKAVCSNGDIFNEEYGKDIARTKAIIKREDAYQSAMFKIYEDINALSYVNVELSNARDGILYKHCDNLDEMLETGNTVSHIYGYVNDNDTYCNYEKFNADDFTPHCCSLCSQTFINYLDDMDYNIHESNWRLLKSNDGANIELCPNCNKVINELVSK